MCLLIFLIPKLLCLFQASSQLLFSFPFPCGQSPTLGVSIMAAVFPQCPLGSLQGIVLGHWLPPLPAATVSHLDHCDGLLAGLPASSTLVFIGVSTAESSYDVSHITSHLCLESWCPIMQKRSQSLSLGIPWKKSVISALPLPIPPLLSPPALPFTLFQADRTWLPLPALSAWDALP